MNHPAYNPSYERLLQEIVDVGTRSVDRTGTGTIKVFGRQIRYDMSDGFPLLTTKKVFTKGVVEELIWFLSGSTNARILQERGVHIWDEWAGEDGELGPVYGAQWRSWPDGDGGSIDQITQVVEQIRNNPFSRRHIVSAWNPAQVEDMALPPCHLLFQFNVQPGEDGEPERLNLMLIQRSADMFLGVPFNIASYALLLHMVAAQTELQPGEFVHTLGDAHIYLNHLDQVKEQLSREPRPFPTLRLTARDSIFEYTSKDVEFLGYDPHPAIKAEVSV